MLKNKMILAFDGPDNVGKSTQIKKVRKWLKEIPFVILHELPPAGLDNTERLGYGEKMENNFFKARHELWKNNIPQINDRIHYSEYAYRMFRDSNKIDDILSLEEKYKELIPNTLIFIFIDKVEGISAREDGDSAYDKDDLKSIKTLIKRFEFISNKSIFDNYIIDINGKNEEEVFKEVEEKIKNKFISL